MNRGLISCGVALRLAAALLAFSAAACRSTPTESPSRAPEPLVSATELAARLGLDRHGVDDAGKLALTAPADSGEILIFPETTVVSVHGARFTTSVPIQFRGGDAWLTKDDAAAVESMWASAPLGGDDGWTPPRAARVEPPTPTPTRPRPAPMSGRGNYSDQPSAAEVRTWTVPLKRTWRYILIHHSASESGNAAQFDAFHRKIRGWDGLGYDFVIGNGRGSGDGAVEVGFRWREQKRGAHAGVDLYNEEAVGICLVGDFTKTRPTDAQMRSLSRLCNFLSAYCGIPRENYLGHSDVRQTVCPGPLFPRDFLGGARPGRVAAGDPVTDEFAVK